ncbi:reverse transcriptase domain-containing protein, partial [Tanacetum coccineum]
GAGSLTLVLLEEDASSSKRFLLAIARDSFCSSRSACESERADAVMKGCDAVTRRVVTASCRTGDAVSRLCEHYVAFSTFRHCRGVTDWVSEPRYSMNVCESSHLPNVAHVLPRIDNAAKDKNPKCWPACCRITRRVNGLVEVEGVEDLGMGNVGNVIVNGNRVGCSYKEFLACNPKEYDGKGGVVSLTRWIKKMESVHDMSGCSIDQKVKYIAGSFVSKALIWWNSQIYTLSQEVDVSMSWNDFKCMMIQEFYPSHEMQKLESELWNHAMVGAGHAAYFDTFHELASNEAKVYAKGCADF